VALVLVMSMGIACGSDGHLPPPVGSGGRSTVPPIIVEFGGTSHTGGSASAGTGTTNGGVPDNFAGTSAFGVGGSFAGDTSSFGGSTTVTGSFGGSTTVTGSFGGSMLPGTDQGGSVPSSLGGTNGISGSF